ncbi:reverse transcriptase family protein [Oryzibacter oryziterrae]|uniref:reverse transcriptase family protein n=1 Tax=Oryzibacter oryziterrae TaxID=2766474 RepID=UPI001F1CE34F|nr:reverse transcriptase family protein [Oryzibacter oryziterrae]
MQEERTPPIGRTALASALVHALSTTAAWTETALVDTFTHVLQGAAPGSVASLARLLAADASVACGPERRLGQIIEDAPSFVRILQTVQRRRLVLAPPLTPPLFRPASRFAGLPLPCLATSGELAAWLGLTPTELDWFAATLPQRGETQPPLQHYSLRAVAKASGRLRLIEAPKTRLKAIQRQILAGILAHVPAHPAAHGFIAGRSVLTAVNPHAGEGLVVAVDLADFFPSTPIGRVWRLFRHLGYPDAVAHLLTGLVTTRTPSPALDGLLLPPETRRRLRVRHLPQGAPTSPALANLAAYGLDVRLSSLASRLDASYSRYADDLVFSGSGPQLRQSQRFLRLVSEIAAAEGYALHPDKTRIMPSSGRQQVLGVTVNAHLNLPRPSYDLLKAILTNACRHGLASQNREGLPHFRDHLNGRIAWFEQVNPARGLKLRALFDRIAE